MSRRPSSTAGIDSDHPHLAELVPDARTSRSNVNSRLIQILANAVLTAVTIVLFLDGRNAGHLRQYRSFMLGYFADVTLFFQGNESTC